MLEKDVVLSKINIIKNCIKAIKSTVNDEVSNLNEFAVENIVVLNLQRACQAAIDMAQTTIAYKKLSLPNSYRAAFQILEKDKIISKSSAEAIAKMAGFRNIAVHDYTEINLEILKHIVKHHLQEFMKYSEEILNTYK